MARKFDFFSSHLLVSPRLIWSQYFPHCTKWAVDLVSLGHQGICCLGDRHGSGMSLWGIACVFVKIVITDALVPSDMMIMSVHFSNAIGIWHQDISSCNADQCQSWLALVSFVVAEVQGDDWQSSALWLLMSWCQHVTTAVIIPPASMKLKGGILVSPFDLGYNMTQWYG